MRMTILEAASCLGISDAQVKNAQGIICSVVTDSQKVTNNSLFVCIKGKNVDGHDYARDAEKNGASAILAQKPLPGLSVPVLVTDDTVRAIGKLANCWREKTTATVICITGTAGKTSLKEVLAAILSEHGKTAKSRLNHNNQIGLPLSILDTDGDEKFWVMEAGINHEGDMDELGAILRPNIGLILNVGDGHLEGLGEKGVAWNKTRLFNYLAAGGKAIICGDYPDLVKETIKFNLDTVCFSARDNKDFEWRAIARDDDAGKCELSLKGKICAVKLALLGIAGAENAIAAATCAAILGLSASDISKGFASVELPAQRFDEQIVGQWHIIDDSYNANPLSMKRMLEAAKIRASKLDMPFYAVLGEMGELGKHAALLHEDLGSYLGKLDACFVIFKGQHFNDVKRGFLSTDRGIRSILHEAKDVTEFKYLLEQIISSGSAMNMGGVILFKGSRSNKLEDFVHSFKEIIGRRVSHNVL